MKNLLLLLALLGSQPLFAFYTWFECTALKDDVRHDLRVGIKKHKFPYPDGYQVYYRTWKSGFNNFTLDKAWVDVHKSSLLNVVDTRKEDSETNATSKLFKSGFTLSQYDDQRKIQQEFLIEPRETQKMILLTISHNKRKHSEIAFNNCKVTMESENSTEQVTTFIQKNFGMLLQD